MTNSKAIRILLGHKDSVLIYQYDYWDYELGLLKDLIEHHPTWTERARHKFDKTRGGDLIQLLESGTIKITDTLPNMTLTYSDIIRKIDDYVKDPIAQPVELSDSKIKHDEYVKEHKEEIDKRHQEFMSYLNRK